MEEPVSSRQGIGPVGCWGIWMSCVFGLGALMQVTFVLIQPLKAFPVLGFLGIWLGAGWGMLLAVRGATRGRWESDGPTLAFSSSTRPLAGPAACVGFGIAFLGIGTAALGQPITLNDRVLSREEVYLGGIIISTLTCVISYVLYGGITRLTFDLAQRRYRMDSGIRPWETVVTGPIEDIEGLRIDEESSEETGTWWHVRLVWKDATREAFSFNRMADRLEARRACERLAMRLGLPFPDPDAGARLNA